MAAEKIRSEVIEACEPLILNNAKVYELGQRLLKSIKKGLSRDGHARASVKCFQTYVQDFPTGKEKGTYLALDLGGSHFRILIVKLNGNSTTPEMTKETYTFSHEEKTGSGEKLFDYIAECLKDFLDKMKIEPDGDPLPLGFTFSFPLHQTGLSEGYLSKWTKGFSATGVENKEIVQLLKDALGRRNVRRRLDPIVIINDTVGTLISCAWQQSHARVGIIVGTGCNACYTEKIENIELFNGDPSKPLMVINTEIGNFGADSELEDIITQYDRRLDRFSAHRGEQLFEKLVAGRYLGEITRQIILKLIEDQILFGGQSSVKMETVYEFKTKFLTDIESQPEGVHNACKEVIEEMGIFKYDKQDLIDVRYIAKVVVVRAISLVSIVIATLINKMGITPVTICLDGTLYRRHPLFKHILYERVECFTNPKIKFELKLSEDGSGRGAAFVAAAKVFNSRVKR